MDRRDFLKNSSLGSLSLMVSASAITSGFPSTALAKSNLSQTWQRYNYQNSLNGLTIAAKNMPSRDQLLEMVHDKIPSADRAEQILTTVMAHTIAEETNDVDATMATMIQNPIYEDVASGMTFVGHQDVMDDYRQKYQAFPDMKRHLTNIMVDKKGCFAEIIWEGEQKGSIRGIKPPKNRPKFYLPVSIYWAVNEDGKITRETVYYDQYLMMLNIDLIPDIANKPLVLAALNPGLLRRRD